MSPNDEFLRITETNPEVYAPSVQTLTCSDKGSTITTVETPPPNVDALNILNCDISSASSLPENLLDSLVAFASPGCGLSTEDVSKLLSRPNFLRALRLSANILMAPLPTNIFDETPKLVELDLSCNPIPFPCEAFRSPKLGLTLRSLNLESCDISAGLVSSISPLYNLRFLDVSSNNLALSELAALCPEVGSSPQFVGKMESLTLLPMATLTDEATFPELFSKVLKRMICLKSLNSRDFAQTMNANIGELAKLALLAGDENTKDSSTCSCLYGNPCQSKYNCLPHVWHRRFEVRRMSRSERQGNTVLTPLTSPSVYATRFARRIARRIACRRSQRWRGRTRTST